MSTDSTGATSPPPQKPRKTGFFRGVIFTSAGSLAGVAALFLETAIAVRFMPPEAYGVYVLLQAVANFYVMLMDFGLKVAVTQFVASATTEDKARIANTVFIFRLLVGLGLGLLVWLFQAPLLWVDPSGGVLLYAGFIPAMFLVASLDQLFMGILQGFYAFQHTAVAQILRSGLRLGLTFIFLYFFDMGVMGLIWSWIISFGFSTLYQYAVAPMPKRFMFYWPGLQQILRFGFPLQLINFLWFFAGQIQILLLSGLAGPAMVAFYSVAAKIPLALARLSESFVSVYFPTMSSLLAEERYEQASWMLNQSLRLSSFVVGVGALFSVLFSTEIMLIFFSATYMDADTTFAVLMISFHMMFLVNLLGFTMTSAGHPRLSLVDNSLRTAVGGFAGLLLIPPFGALGGAIANMLSNYLANPTILLLLRLKGIHAHYRDYTLHTLLLWVGSLIFWLSPETLHSNLALHYSLKISLLLLFVALNLFLRTIAVQDFISLIPPRYRRFGGGREVVK
jgi:O-antigen/teichoic acid export membrane protein